MLKTLLKIGMTFFLLLGCCFGYVRAFKMVVQQFASERPDNSRFVPIRTAKSKQQAHDLARQQFGAAHWTVTTDLGYAYYNSQQGYWMYWQNYEEIKEENGVRYDGKRVRMWPFAMIGKTGGGKNVWRLTADRATLDMNQPIGLSSKPDSEGIKVEHAYIEGDVRIRDDHGTPALTTDDMNIGPLTYLDYDDAKHVIKSESHVDIVDPDQTTAGDGLFIQMRKADSAVAAAASSSSTGFSGVEYAILRTNARVTLRDVGNSGFLPTGGAQSASAGKTGARTKTVGVVADSSARQPKAQAAPDPVPLYIQSDGSMHVDLPPDKRPVAVGPPAPPLPTLVRFDRNVVALHGRLDKEPNQLNCDTLRLTMIPGSAAPAQRDKGKADEKAKSGSSENSLARAAPAAGSSEKAGPGAVSPAATPPQPGGTNVVVTADTAARPTAESSAQPKVAAKTASGDRAAQSQPPTAPADGSLFGNLTLKRAHATGHAVWLQLRPQAAKVRCSEMIHERNMPYEPDTTFFRGDLTRPVWLEKTDFEQDEEAGQLAGASGTGSTSADPAAKVAKKVKSVTHVTTATAKLVDRGNGLDLADVHAFGPGRLESRPNLTEPVERIAIWQDELTIVNVVGPDGKLKQKQVTLTGTRPFFVDLTRKTSLDAAEKIKIHLKPRSPTPAEQATATATQAATDRSPTTHSAAKPMPSAVGGDAFAARTETSARGTSEGDAGLTSGLGGSLQIEHLTAWRDVHFLAPNRRMEARVWLDAPFIEVDPPPPTATTTEPATGGSATENQAAAPAPAASSPNDGSTRPEETKPPTGGTVAATEPASEPEAEPAMTAVADRVVATITMPRGKALDSGKSSRRAKPARKPTAPGPEAADTGDGEWSTPSPATAAEPKEAEADIREALLRGNVALHQDAAPDPDRKGKPKPKGNDITGESVYFYNRGPGKINARVFHRDPTDPATPMLGPIHWAKVSNDDMIAYGETLYMDQEKDKIWAFGPGILSQWTDRALLSDKTPETKADSASPPAPATASGPSPATAQRGASAATPVRTASRTTPNRAGGASTVEGDRAAMSSTAPVGRAADAPAPPAKPRTRAGKPVGEKDLLFITWTKSMEFNGRTVDPSGQPAGRADFFGIVDAWMTDAKLHCEQKMIVFTDREVPLGQIGSTIGKPGRKGNDRREEPDLPEGDENADREAPTQSRVDIALLFCYGNPTALNRKVDPELPIVLEQDRIDAWDHYEDPTDPKNRKVVPGELDYNRRTGEFFVPGPGIVFLFDRPDEKSPTDPNAAPSRPATDGNRSSRDPSRAGQRPVRRQTVTTTSARVPDRADATGPPASRNAAVAQQANAPATPPVKRTVQPLVLMQVKFSEAMKGRVGAGRADDTAQERWSEFYGNIEFVRSQVKDSDLRTRIDRTHAVLNPDQRLSEDGFYLTSQMLRVIQEPPPAGSPDKTPARSFAKAWDRVHVNKGEEFAIESDVATFNSETNLLWAYGEGGREVTFAQQHGPGQPISPSYARAVQYNLKSHTWREIDGTHVSIIDHRTGVRPTPVGIPDPTAPGKKKIKSPFKVPNTNLERRGFTGY